MISSHAAPDAMCPALAKQLPTLDGKQAAGALVDRARRLRASLAAGPAAPLRGRHVAIAAERHDTPSACLFERAASSLGARVSHIGPDALALDPQRQETAARILGSLYDAIDFIPLPPERAESLRDAAGVPIFADLGGERSPLRALLTTQDETAEREAELLALMQAVLVDAMR
jgi:ornithine carbamoyltransferase